MKENCLRAYNKKNQKVLESWKMVNNVKEERSTIYSIKLMRLKLVLYCIQLTINKILAHILWPQA